MLSNDRGLFLDWERICELIYFPNWTEVHKFPGTPQQWKSVFWLLVEAEAAWFWCNVRGSALCHRAWSAYSQGQWGTHTPEVHARVACRRWTRGLPSALGTHGHICLPAPWPHTWKSGWHKPLPGCPPKMVSSFVQDLLVEYWHWFRTLVKLPWVSKLS